MRKQHSTTAALLSLLLAPLLLALPTSVQADNQAVTGGGTFVNNQSVTFNVITSYEGYTFYNRGATGALSGSVTGLQSLQAFGVIFPSGAIVEQGTVTCSPCTVDGQTGTITGPFNVYAADGVHFVGEELNAIGSGGLAGFYETSVYQGTINPTGPSAGTYQTVYEFGGLAAPSVEAPLAQYSSSSTSTFTNGPPVVIGGFTFITATQDSTSSGGSSGTCTGVANDLLVIYPDGLTTAFADTCTFVGTVNGSAPGSYLETIAGQGSFAGAGFYTLSSGASDGTGGLAGIQGTGFLSATLVAPGIGSDWVLLPNAVGPDVNLQNANLQGLVLQGYTFAGDNIQKASFANDNLGGLNFAGANLQWADLSGATLTGTPSQNTIFDAANMQQADLTNAVCGSPNYITASGAHTQQVILTGSSGCSPPF